MKGEYQGKPVIPFSFGLTKAKHLLQAIADNGVDAVLDALKGLVALKDQAWVDERFGKDEEVVPESVEEEQIVLAEHTFMADVV